MRTPLYTVELLYSNTLKWGHLCIQWNSSTPTPWNEDTSVYSGTPLFQPPEMRTPLYTVEHLYSNNLKWGHLCIQWNSSIPTLWNEDTSVYSGTPLFQPPEMRTPVYSDSNRLKWGHFCIGSVSVPIIATPGGAHIIAIFYSVCYLVGGANFYSCAVDRAYHGVILCVNPRHYVICNILVIFNNI